VDLRAKRRQQIVVRHGVKDARLARRETRLRCLSSDAAGSVLKALKELEKGWERAIGKIAERAGLTKRAYTVTPAPIFQRRV
jgi:hypothetical protein